MTDLADAEQLREQAKQAVDRFVRRFDESYRLLAYHAALPLVLTPELVNYLRNEFLRGEQVPCPWVAEVDLLLSDLCSQVGYELYAMETHVREYLLKEMQQDSRFGKPRMQKVAQVLYSYVNYLSRLNPGRRQQEIEAQRWAAMVYLGDEQCKKAAREITQRLIETSSGTGSASLTESGIRAELARLTRITEELSPQLQQEGTLLDYARLVQRVLRTPEFVTPDELNRSYQIDDQKLTFPQRLLPKVLAEAVTSSVPRVTRIEGFPEINIFEFELAVISIEDDTRFPLQSFEFEVATITGINQSNTSNNLVDIADNLVFSHGEKHLDEIEQLIIHSTISNQNYEQMAASSNYSKRQLKDVASNLWKVLSEALAKKVNKTNLKNVIQQQVNYSQIDIHRSFRQAQYFIEDLGNEIWLEMVQIPGDTFVMGSPPEELEHQDDESPQHTVTVQPFFMGKYSVTQAQWKAVAALPQINRELDADPSKFKGANRPVERVSWYDAVEFCDRLSQYTGRPYSLPSEAEWEYACRAGTTTPFHFGETITSELANYRATETYGAGVKGTYREETTPVGSFNAANAFGLYDMHGNVWEWCLDDWHNNYEGAPTDGSPWLDNKNDNLSQKQGRAVLRGGSWFNDPKVCRSASRFYDLSRDFHYFNFGFRIVCGVGRIL